MKGNWAGKAKINLAAAKKRLPLLLPSGLTGRHDSHGRIVTDQPAPGSEAELQLSCNHEMEVLAGVLPKGMHTADTSRYALPDRRTKPDISYVSLDGRHLVRIEPPA